MVDAIGGAVGEVVQTAMFYPLDTIKVQNVKRYPVLDLGLVTLTLVSAFASLIALRIHVNGVEGVDFLNQGCSQKLGLAVPTTETQSERSSFSWNEYRTTSALSIV